MTTDFPAFTACLERPTADVLPSRAELERLLGTYPWFTTARLLRGEEAGRRDPRLELALLTRPVPACLLEHPSPDDFDRRSETEIIGAFLRKGEYRIVPQEDTPEAELASAWWEEDEDVPVSEELAEIYLAQGVFEEARKIYSKLSLLYPEKSVYFAEIMAKTAAGTE